MVFQCLVDDEFGDGTQYFSSLLGGLTINHMGILVDVAEYLEWLLKPGWFMINDNFSPSTIGILWDLSWGYGIYTKYMMLGR